MEGESSSAIAAASAVVEQIGGEHGEKMAIGCSSSSSCGPAEGGGICAICLESIALQDVALVKGCEHAHCVTCILTWVTYSKNPSCPQCKHPFEFLIIHRTLDGCIRDFMFEESVCLLLRASWFVPLTVETKEEAREEAYDELDIFQYEYNDEDEDFDEDYYVSRTSTLHIGNRRWGDGGYIRTGRKEARPVDRQQSSDPVAGPSSQKNKAVAKGGTGRRAKRAMKREAADKAAAAKHQHHLEKLGRK